jgi:hypothetical protein
MKLQIINKNQDKIEGYTVVKTDGKELDMANIVDNSCEQIFAPDVTDSFPIQSIQELVTGFVQKLRLGGELVIGGTDIRLFCKNVSNGAIPLPEGSNMITVCNSMTTPDQIIQILSSLKLDVKNVHMNGLHYEIKAKRG